MPFTDRTDAGRRLAPLLKAYSDQSPVVVALPRGGVIVAEPVAEALGAPLDIVFVRRVASLGNPEFAIGAVAERLERAVVSNPGLLEALGCDPSEFQERCQREFAEIGRRRKLYLGGRSPPSLNGRTVIVVDDGLATGSTMHAALLALRAEHPARVVVAVPVGPPGILAQLATEVDDVVCVERPASFVAVGAHYRNFDQVTDSEVAAALTRAARRARHEGSPGEARIPNPSRIG